MEFRIKVFLYNFFVDYRKMCFIYVNSNMKTIGDLINYISLKFDISTNLYLTLNDMYLPHFEDIRILSKDDTVVAHRHNDEQHSAKKSLKRKKDKKVVHDKPELYEASTSKYNSTNDEVYATQEDDVQFPEEMSIDYNAGEDCTDSLSTPVKKKKKKNVKQVDEIVEIEANEPIRVAQAVVTEYVRRKKIDLLPISTIPKIVTPIIVYDNIQKLDCTYSNIEQSNSLLEKCELLTPKLEIQDQKPILNSDILLFDNLETSQSETMLTQSDVLNANEYDKSFEFVVPPECKPKSERTSQADPSSEWESVIDSLAPTQLKVKRKRHRVRSRKPKKEFVPQPLPNLQISPASSVSSSPHLHIRFNDDGNENVVDSIVEKIQNGINKVDPVDKSEVNYEDLCVKEIVQFPIMKHVFPSKNDVIAFKRYMLSADYTPEISNYIIGRVCSFSCDTLTVVVKILEGKDQCNNPQGKFFIEENENPVEKEEMEFSWPKLIEPRLLFP